MLEPSIAAPPLPTVWSQIKLREIFAISSTHYRGTQIFSGLLVLGVFLGLNKFTRESLSSDVTSVLIETKILKLVSSIFVSTEVLWSIFHVLVMIVFGSLVEKVRGTYSLLIFVIQICLISELLTLVTFLSLYYFTFDTFYLGRRVCGFDAMLGAFIMCITEIAPNQLVIPKQTILTFQYMPFVLLLSVMGLHLIGVMGLTQMYMTVCGTWVGWLVLRFFAPNLHDPYEKGNASEEFELQYLFPPLLRFPVRQIANVTYAIFKNIGCCETPTGAGLAKGSSNGVLLGNSVGGSAANLSENLNDLVLGLSGQNASDGLATSDTDMFTDSVIRTKYSGQDVDDVEAQKRQEAKNLIEKRLQQIQKEYTQRIISNSAHKAAADH